VVLKGWERYACRHAAQGKNKAFTTKATKNAKRGNSMEESFGDIIIFSYLTLLFLRELRALRGERPVFFATGIRVHCIATDISGGWRTMAGGKRRVRWLILLCCLLLPTALRAEPLSLQQAVQLALTHAPAMRAAEAGRDALSEDAALGRAGLLPYVEINGSYQRRRQNTAYDTPQAFFKTNLKYDESRMGMKIVQSLFDLERWAGYRQGELSAESGELSLRLERQRLMLETAQSFLNVVTSQSALVAAMAREAAAEKLAAQAQASFRVGTSAMPERLDAEARRDLAKADRLVAANDLDHARATLASLTGQPVTELVPPVLSDTPAALTAKQPEYWEEQAAGHAIAVLLAEVQFGVAKQGKRKSLGGALPKVEAFGEINGDRSSDSVLGGSTLRDQAVGVQFRMPLYAGGGTTAQMRKSEKEALQAEFSLADDIRLARLTARQAFLARQAAVAQLAAMQQAVLSARQAALSTHRGHEVGLRSLTETLDADERAFAAAKNLAVARAQFVFAILQLKASVGALTNKPMPAVFGEKP